MLQDCNRDCASIMRNKPLTIRDSLAILSEEFLAARPVSRRGNPECTLFSFLLSLSLLFFSSTFVLSDDPSLEEIPIWVQSLGGRIERDSQGIIRAMDLKHAWITDADLHRIGAIETIEMLDLGYTKIDDEGLERLKKLTTLRSLSLRYAEYITDIGIAHLKNAKRLEHLDLRGTKVTSSVFETLANFPALLSLDIGFSRVNDDYFEWLSELPSLETLRIGGNKMSGAALPLLKLCPNLRELDLSGQQRTDSGLWSMNLTDFNVHHVAALRELRTLDVSGTSISDRGVAMLSPLSKLEQLDLSRTKVTAKGIASLQVFPHLSHLSLRQCDNLEVAAFLELSRLPLLATLELQESKLSVLHLRELQSSKTLRQLYLGGIPITEVELDSLRKTMKECLISWWKKPEIEKKE